MANLVPTLIGLSLLVVFTQCELFYPSASDQPQVDLFNGGLQEPVVDIDLEGPSAEQQLNPEQQVQEQESVSSL